jgi:hypothetical protein
VDLRDLVAFAQRFDVGAEDALGQLSQFAETVMANFGAADFVARVRAIDAVGRAWWEMRNVLR